jgi:MoxR-like ATPase
LITNPSIELRSDAQGISDGVPALIAKARHLAATLSLGVHGRRRSGLGEEFWQYRQADVGDSARDIDWRRSAQGDQYFIRQTEWQTAQAVHFWVDHSASMQFRAGNPEQSKSQRANILAVAIALLLSKGGERFAHLDDVELPKSGAQQITRFTTQIVGRDSIDDYGTPENKAVAKGSRAVFISDFLGDWDAIVDGISRIADQDVQGALVQVLDPQELAFPFTGRTIFESMKGSVSFEARRANGLRDAYLDRLAERQENLKTLARRTGWRTTTHQTDQTAQSALLWLYNVMQMGA